MTTTAVRTATITAGELLAFSRRALVELDPSDQFRLDSADVLGLDHRIVMVPSAQLPDVPELQLPAHELRELALASGASAGYITRLDAIATMIEGMRTGPVEDISMYPGYMQRVLRPKPA